MARVHAPLYAFNRGEVGVAALGRVDVERLRLSAEEQINFLPTVLGPMTLRPGLQYIGGTYSNLTGRLMPFVFANDDLALLELTDELLRVWTIASDTETLITRSSVSTAVTNGDMSSATGWTLTATGTGASATVNTGTAGKMVLASPAKGGIAQGKATVTVSAGDAGVRHAFRIVVDRGPVTFRAGTADGDDDYINETTLDTGTHSLAFTPVAGTVYLQFETQSAQSKIVDSITIESSGTFTLASPWDVGDLPYLRFTQSGDVIFAACDGYPQYKIERRALTSWSIVRYYASDGPFQSANGTDITMTPSVLAGNGTLTASRGYFEATHVGCLFRLFSTGQSVSNVLCGAARYSDTIRVAGAAAVDRRFSYTITGTWSGTLTLQRSEEGETTGFRDVVAYDTAINVGATNIDDALTNVVAWYRWIFKTGNYTSGSATISMTYLGGGGAGVCRVTALTSATVVSVEVLSPFTSLNATDNWSEGDWSDLSGWPSAVAFHDGRLWWSGRDKIWASVSDDYTSFDPDVEGDSGPISRSVGFGPIATVNWLLPLTRLIVGRQSAETSIRSSSFDEPLTPTNFTLKDCSTQGSAAVAAVKIDTRGVFIQQSERRAYMLGYNVEVQDYQATDLTRLNPDIGTEDFTELGVQRQPDTMLHFTRGDGQVASLVHDTQDQVEAWWRIETDGVIESVTILPGNQEDRLYFLVKRTINSSNVRYIEKMALRTQCTGLPSSRLADSFVVYDGAATTSISGLGHLNNENVVVWGWNDVDTTGTDLGTYTVSGGSITNLSQSVENAIVGLSYTGTFKSAKLAYGAQLGTGLEQIKKVDTIGLLLRNTHYQGIEFGQSFTRMDNLPLVKDGAAVSTGTVHSSYDERMVPLPGNWDTDARLCLRATAPRPCTVLAAVIGVTTNES